MWGNFAGGADISYMYMFTFYTVNICRLRDTVTNENIGDEMRGVCNVLFGGWGGVPVLIID